MLRMRGQATIPTNTGGVAVLVAGGDRIYGRKRAIEFVRVLMAREERNGSLQNRRFPVLVVEGFRGAGKTALLSELVDLLDQRVPHGRLDFGTNSRASVPEVLAALACELSRNCPRYGALQFHRFIVGRLVMRLQLDLNDRVQARRQVVDALRSQRWIDTTRVLADTTGGVLQTMGSGIESPVKPPLRSLFELVLKGLTGWAPGQNVILRSGQKWYGHRDLELPHDAIDVLVDLNNRANNSEDEHDRQWVDELLWAAFLADLRAEFGRRRRVDERSLNCVILLDNADTVLGRRFLNQLVQARRRRVAGGQDDADPLTVVATSRGVLLADVPHADQALVPDSRAGQLPDTTDWSPFWWLRYPLPDLITDEVGRAVADMDLAWGDNQRLTRVVYALTEGHPASTRLVLDAIARSAPQKWIEPEVVLRHVRSGAGSERRAPVEDRMLDHLLDEMTADAFRDLVTCAAAREREEALVLAGQDGLLLAGQDHYGEVLDPILWPSEALAGPTLLRRLLRRQLARRDASVSPNWREVYGLLRDACRRDRDEAGELYYALAAGELGFVTQQLHRRLTEFDSTAWSALLTSVTAAPRRDRAREAPISEVGVLLVSADLDDTLVSVGRLVAALWIAADPCTNSRRGSLHLQIGDSYAEVSRLCPGGPHGVFLEAARRHRREAEWWD
ncbi:MAG: hypothetical protein ACRDUV_27265 [Pseudonocardiaceae bacterium]